MSFEFMMKEAPDSGGDYVPLVPEEPRYYRVNQAGHVGLIALMEASGVLDPSAQPPGLIQALLAFSLQPPTRAERRAAKGEDVPVAGSVPAYKYLSNDHWRVSPFECRQVARAFAEMRAAEGDVVGRLAKELDWKVEDVAQLAEGWERYNRIAASAGGYTVY
jgi:hypothetical protein